MDQKDRQFDLAKTELELTQRQMDKYDQMSVSVKTWGITLWAATVGWSFQAKRKEVILISLLVVLMFWYFDGLNKTFREHYKKRRYEVAGALEKFFKSGAFPPEFSSPKVSPQNFMEAFKNILQIHIGLPYFLLAVVSLLLYVYY